MSDFFVTVGGRRAALFRQIFGSDLVPVLSPLPQWAELPGRGRSLVYLMDLAAISAEQRGRIVSHVVTAFGTPAAEVEHDLDAVGMPILAEDCSVTVLNPQKWM